MANKDNIELADLEEARDKVRWGRAKKSRVVDQKEKEITAYHEAGHTLVQSLLEDADPLHKVSIIPRGPMGGATFALPEKDRTIFTKDIAWRFYRSASGVELRKNCSVMIYPAAHKMIFKQPLILPNKWS